MATETFLTVPRDTETLVTVPIDMGNICNCCQGYGETFITVAMATGRVLLYLFQRQSVPLAQEKTKQELVNELECTAGTLVTVAMDMGNTYNVAMATGTFVTIAMDTQV